ncbi:MAG TPA: BBE domain-containing protein [Myxococcota bacterium]|nr:BBE domain-containing protein [Myxococcota bacterium]
MLPIKRFGAALIDTIGPASYADTNTIFDASFPRGAHNYWKSSFLGDLSDAAIEALIRQFSACPSAMSGLFLEHFHGAATRVGSGDSAFPHRRTGYNLLVISQWLDAKADEPNVAWARASYDALRPYMARESYANYQTDDATDDAAQSLYGPNIEKLVAIKNKLDPTNFFHLNQNIQPTR